MFIRHSPWAVIAVALHAALLATFGLFAVRAPAAARFDPGATFVLASRASEREPPIVPVPEPIDRAPPPPAKTGELVPSDLWFPDSLPAPDAPEDLTAPIGDPHAVALLPSGGGPGGNGAIGPGADSRVGAVRPSSRGGPGDGYGPRRGRHVDAPVRTEKAVFHGLLWLLRHQSDDGSWRADGASARCRGPRPCAGRPAAGADGHTEGLTALALLAFLGAGHGPDSQVTIVDPLAGKRHRIGEPVLRGLRWLLRRQKPDGSFTPGRAFLYNEALAAMALSEAWGLSGSRLLREPAERAVRFLERAQRRDPRDGRSPWGWRYAAREDVEARRAGYATEAEYRRDLHDADTSVTAWVVLALKSAATSGLAVAPEAWEGARAFVRHATAPDDRVGYLDAAGAGEKVQGERDHYETHPTMEALGMCIRIFAGGEDDEAPLQAAARLLVQDRPRAGRDRLSVDYYYWYHATLALHQIDGPGSPRRTGRLWEPWNAAMTQALLPLQETGEGLCAAGAWLVPDRWGFEDGPIYATALNVLTLEVYYRYENAFGTRRRK